MPSKSENTQRRRSTRSPGGVSHDDLSTLNAPQRLPLDEVRCTLLVELCEVLMEQTVEAIQYGTAVQYTSTEGGNNDKSGNDNLNLADIEASPDLSTRRDTLAASILTGVRTRPLLLGVDRMVLWSALIKVLAWRLPILTPFQLHALHFQDIRNPPKGDDNRLNNNIPANRHENESSQHNKSPDGTHEQQGLRTIAKILIQQATEATEATGTKRGGDDHSITFLQHLKQTLTHSFSYASTTMMRILTGVPSYQLRLLAAVSMCVELSVYYNGELSLNPPTSSMIYGRFAL